MPTDTNSRAALAGLAATGSLLAATAAAALVVGGLLGFGAFPGAADDTPTAPLRVAPAPAGAAARAPAPIVMARAPHRTPRRSLPSPAGNHTVRAPRRHRGLPVAPRLPAHGAGAVLPAAPAPADPAPNPSGGAPSPRASGDGPLAPAAHAARDAGASAARAGPPAPAPVAGPVQSAAAPVAGAVEQGDHAVAATLNTVGR
jgi:hypothetical protein